MKKDIIKRITAVVSAAVLTSPALYTAAAAGIRGDVNSDNKVDRYDASQLCDFLLGKSGQCSAEGDMNGDGVIDAFDLCILREKLLNPDPQTPDTPVTPGPGTSSIPDLGTAPNTSATMYDNFRTGKSSYFFASDGWENGDPFDCGWFESNCKFEDGALTLTIDKDKTGKYNYAGAEFRTTDHYHYGYYETSMQAIKNDGVVSSFFTYTGESEQNPWDEIDIEILGKDTTKVQFNYYTNGQGNHEFMYDLGFDSSEAFHTYGFDWQPNYIAWYVDGKEVYRATNNIPQTAGRIMMNTWPGRGVDGWLAHYNGKTPLTARYQWVTYNESGVSGGGNNNNNNNNNNGGGNGGWGGWNPWEQGGNNDNNNNNNNDNNNNNNGGNGDNNGGWGGWNPWEQGGNNDNNNNNNDNNNGNNGGSSNVTASGLIDYGTAPDTSADMYDNFRTGKSSYFFASDGWENGDPFDCGWYENNCKFQDGALTLTIDRDYSGKYNYAGAEYRTTDHYHFGYYETSMQAIKNDGVVSSFFTYTGESEHNPWDEIDIEILGKDTTKVQFNYYTNGQGKHEYMYDLGFDSSEGYHTYGFDWQPNYIAWYVDGKEVYRATSNIPQTAGRIMMNTWPGRGVDEWLAHYNGRTPLTARYQWVTYKKK